MSNGYDWFMRPQIQGQPQPPRQMPLAEVVKRVSREESSLLLMGVGGGLAVVAFVIVSLAPGNSILRLSMQAFFAAFAMWTVARPLLVAMRIQRAFSTGYRTSARVLEASVTEPRNAGATVDSLRYGVAHGRWEVHHPSLSMFVDTFQTDAPWAMEIKPGSVIEVLVDPQRPRVLLELRHLGTGTTAGPSPVASARG